MSASADNPRIGQTVGGKYRLDAVIGQGGMGTVFAATHSWTGRRVAVKLLNADLARDAGVVARFLQEARAAATLSLTNVVDVLDMGQDADGMVYLVLELLQGQSLAALLEQRTMLEPSETLAILAPVMRALIAAHERGIIHRDLKPDNIFISRNAEGQVVPKLLDFGIAKVLEQHNSLGTKTGNVIGTPHYMSPEQAIGAVDVGPASDAWSMGVVLYQCLSGVLPFDGPNVTSVLLALTTRPAIPLSERRPDLSPALCAAVDRALISDRSRRHRDVAALLESMAETQGARARTSLEPDPFAATHPEPPPSPERSTPEPQADIVEPVRRSAPHPAGGLISSQDLGAVPLAEPPPAALMPSTPGAWATTGVPVAGGRGDGRSSFGVVAAIAGVVIAAVVIGGGATLLVLTSSSTARHGAGAPAVTAEQRPEPLVATPQSPSARAGTDAGASSATAPAQPATTVAASSAAFAEHHAATPIVAPPTTSEPRSTDASRGRDGRRRHERDRIRPAAPAPITRPPASPPRAPGRTPAPMLRTF